MSETIEALQEDVRKAKNGIFKNRLSYIGGALALVFCAHVFPEYAVERDESLASLIIEGQETAAQNFDHRMRIISGEGSRDLQPHDFYITHDAHMLDCVRHSAQLTYDEGNYRLSGVPLDLQEVRACYIEARGQANLEDNEAVVHDMYTQHVAANIAMSLLAFVFFAGGIGLARGGRREEVLAQEKLKQAQKQQPAP
ncbi:MAG: hypothetical protein GC136_04790 [Alphaproteobacteria bacterium]|nr:hypothetical protein [Alphaproteobacteria bacterium]